MPILVIGAFLLGAWTLARRAPGSGDMRLNPAPQRDDAGRVYYAVEQWNGSAWVEYGRRYLGP
ncbi:MAG TPA: hypothetical protein VF420_13215 [Casimicrobiaceae bacterium]